MVDGGTVRLPALIGLSRALDIILTGRTVEATEAHQIGLANYLAEPGKALEKAHEIAALLASFPQTCMKNDRRSAIDSAYGGGVQHSSLIVSGKQLEHMKREFELGRQTLSSSEFQEGIEGFSSRKQKM